MSVLQRRALACALGALLTLVGCSGSGADAPRSRVEPPSGLETDALSVIAHRPDVEAVQVPFDAEIEVELDGPIALESLFEPETGLRVSGSNEDVAGSFRATSRGFAFRPDAPLAEETDYEFTMSALTSDVEGRLLDASYGFTFRTVDETAPRFVESTLANGAVDEPRTSTWSLTANEALDPTSVTDASLRLQDSLGNVWPLRTQVRGATIDVTPVVDLPGERRFVLGALGIRDRAGNRQEEPFVRTFVTAADHRPPAIASVWPAGDGALSPRAAIEVRFDESIVPNPGGVVLVDQAGRRITVRLRTSADARTLHVEGERALRTGAVLTLTLTTGPGAIADTTGNTFAGSTTHRVSVAADDRAPRIASTFPAEDAVGVSLNAQPEVVFDEPLDPTRISEQNVRLLDADGSAVAGIAVAAIDGDRGVRIVPGALLRPATTYVVRLEGGDGGLRDPLGNDIATTELRFTTANDATLPRLVVTPQNGDSAVAPESCIVVVADSPLDPASVGPETLVLSEESTAGAVAGALTLERGRRVLRFVPAAPLVQGRAYLVRVAGGRTGLREASGNRLDTDVVHRFVVGSLADVELPRVDATLNRVADLRNRDLVVPTHGFTIDVDGSDPLGSALDPSTFDVEIVGDGAVRDSDWTFQRARVDEATFSLVVSADAALPPGRYTLRASVADRSGNRSYVRELRFRVEAARASVLPFERTQVVWVRFDLDRDGNGRADFEDDLHRLGLCTEGDPSGTNARMVELLQDGVLSRTHRLFLRADNGARLGADSIAVRLTDRRPLGVPFMQMACGGFDPEGPLGRQVGDRSTGTLGRAPYDEHNTLPSEIAIGSNPGFGVFPSELWLFESRIHLQIGSSFTTRFAGAFVPLAPAFGGEPAGSRPVDRDVLASSFDWNAASSVERARYATVMSAADDWATAIGTILAHEIGHAVGLVKPGRTSDALHGDASYHNEFAGPADIMAAATGFESLVELEHSFRDLSIAYLRHRILLVR